MSPKDQRLSGDEASEKSTTTIEYYRPTIIGYNSERNGAKRGGDTYFKKQRSGKEKGKRWRWRH
jgi:hypothetical protein